MVRATTLRATSPFTHRPATTAFDGPPRSTPSWPSTPAQPPRRPFGRRCRALRWRPPAWHAAAPEWWRSSPWRPLWGSGREACSGIDPAPALLRRRPRRSARTCWVAREDRPTILGPRLSPRGARRPARARARARVRPTDRRRPEWQPPRPSPVRALPAPSARRARRSSSRPPARRDQRPLPDRLQARRRLQRRCPRRCRRRYLLRCLRPCLLRCRRRCHNAQTGWTMTAISSVTSLQIWGAKARPTTTSRGLSRRPPHQDHGWRGSPCVTCRASRLMRSPPEPPRAGPRVPGTASTTRSSGRRRGRRRSTADHRRALRRSRS